ncbi:MAG: hypothetical protein IPO92_23845 [Saprospiraceae bacterium]|nr:hypothetical protein [Saprospiraceae bacterium]
MNKFVNDNVIFMAVHHSGGLNNPTATAFSNNFEGSGQPIFYADGADLNANSGNVNNVLSDAEAVVGFNSSVPAFAGVGIDASYSLNSKTLTVNSKVEFFD